MTPGRDEADDIIGMASGVVAFTSRLGFALGQVSHIARAVAWKGYGPMLSGGTRVVSAEARSELWVANFPKARVRPLLDGRTTWWRFVMQLAAKYGPMSAMIAGDLLIPESERRLAAGLHRFGGFRVLGNPGADDVPAMAPVVVPVTQAELAAAATCGATLPERSCRFSFGRRRMVETGYRGITITDPAGLLSVVDSRRLVTGKRRQGSARPRQPGPFLRGPRRR